MEPTREGYLIEMRVIERLLELGYRVLRDVLPQSRTDLWVMVNERKLVGIQVKKVKTYRRKDKINGKTFKILKMGKSGNPYKREDVDFFIAVDGDMFYVVPHELAYRDNESRIDFYLSHENMGRFDLIPAPRIEDKVMVEEKQDMLFVVNE